MIELGSVLSVESSLLKEPNLYFVFMVTLIFGRFSENIADGWRALASWKMWLDKFVTDKH